MAERKRAKQKRAPQHQWKPAFLAALEETGVVRDACDAAGIVSSQAYTVRLADEEFRDAWARALDRSADRLEREAIRRAVNGWEEPVYQNGALVGHKHRFSDTLLIFMLKAIRPAKFRDNYQSDDIEREVYVIEPPRRMSDEED